MKGEWVRRGKGVTAVVFVHGILSSGEACWRHENGSYWPELLKSEPELGSLGIYVFTYQTGIFSGSYRLGDIVDALKEYMRLDGVLGNDRLIFVCHSMGGIVVRKFILERATELIEAKKEIGLFLVSSPSLGSSYADWLFPLAQLFGHAQADVLRFVRDNDWLQDLDKEFNNLKEAGKLRIRGKELVEDKFVILRKLLRRQVVEPFSGARYFGEPFKVPGADHFSIAKPENNGAIQHRLLCQFISAIKETGDQQREDGGKALPTFEIGICTDKAPLEMECTGEIVGGVTSAQRIAEEIELDTRPSDRKRFEVRVTGLEKIRRYLAGMTEVTGLEVEVRHKLRMAQLDWERRENLFRAGVDFILWNPVFHQAAHLHNSRDAAETICGFAKECFSSPYFPDGVRWFLWYQDEHGTLRCVDLPKSVKDFMETGYYEDDCQAETRRQGLHQYKIYKVEVFFPNVKREYVLPKIVHYAAEQKASGASQVTIDKYLDVSQWEWSVSDPHKFAWGE